MAFSWLAKNRGDPNYLLTGMILQVGRDLTTKFLTKKTDRKTENQQAMTGSDGFKDFRWRF